MFIYLHIEVETQELYKSVIQIAQDSFAINN